MSLTLIVGLFIFHKTEKKYKKLARENISLYTRGVQRIPNTRSRFAGKH